MKERRQSLSSICGVKGYTGVSYIVCSSGAYIPNSYLVGRCCRFPSKRLPRYLTSNYSDRTDIFITYLA